ncbi:hypothetical protein LQ327_09390 [Actinomycetospora endophytica]|uniref:DUF2637 domain-containing protein n=1 Tax=Actinomycetospora endophytica TaxID=2291215 RepID=A0ABS8P5R4_9PSEU|nr:hypothetical protein [Actinomycetospora endophytica]MCD2193593.1 hypothetical protein [Actinomycetospora endophytica]
MSRPGGGSWAGVVIWVPGLAVACGAAAATVHGLYEVAVASRVPPGIAWLYPLITDGLALVAYAATARLHGTPARYAWTIVAIAAGLSGLAQAAYLAGGPTVDVSPALRFGIGAWPAIAAAVVAHLLYLLATESPDGDIGHRRRDAEVFNATGSLASRSEVQPGVQSEPFSLPSVQPEDSEHPVHPGPPGDPDQAPGPVPPVRPGPRSAPSPARDRAAEVATHHAQRQGAWPTVTELETAAAVSRGTAAAALKALRHRPLPLHLINTTNPDGEQPPNTHPETQP